MALIIHAHALIFSCEAEEIFFLMSTLDFYYTEELKTLY